MNVVTDLSRVQNETNRQDEPRIIVHSEDDPDRTLLETRICREDGFQKQQGTCNDHGLDAMRWLIRVNRDSDRMDRTSDWD